MHCNRACYHSESTQLTMSTSILKIPLLLVSTAALHQSYKPPHSIPSAEELTKFDYKPDTTAGVVVWPRRIARVSRVRLFRIDRDPVPKQILI